VALKKVTGETIGAPVIDLNADVAALGSDKFTREILYLCKGRGEMSYIEAREQFDRRVLETDEYYNGIINVRVGGSDKLKQALLEHPSRQNNPTHKVSGPVCKYR
jgi:hypothetical protein